MKKGVLLINLGTPDSPAVPDVRRYLREFLSDPFVIDAPALVRWLLLNLVILPFRPRKSAEAYSAIWMEAGSPLLVYSKQLAEAVQKFLGDEFHVELAMRYGRPSIEDGVAALKQAGCRQWVVAPLYPQYAESTTESSRKRVKEVIDATFSKDDRPLVQELLPFFDDSYYLSALKQVTSQALADFSPDHLLMSYHGLPERHLAPPICKIECEMQSKPCPPMCAANKNCYRAQCFACSTLLAKELGLSTEHYTVSFQSRLGRIPWIGPDTEKVIKELHERGVRRLAVVMPAFVADCLETLEEIGLQLREQWLQMPDTHFQLVPCLNASTPWVHSLSDMIRAV